VQGGFEPAEMLEIDVFTVERGGYDEQRGL